MSSSEQRGTESAGPKDGKPPSQAARRAAHLQTAIALRDRAERAQSTDARRALTQLAVLYEELAEYLVSAATRTPAQQAPPKRPSEGPPEEPVDAQISGDPDRDPR
jgi:hypothetical protein